MLPSPAGREASSGTGAPPYVRHRPERTLLYQIVDEYYPAFKAHLAAQGTALPRYVQQEFDMLFLDGVYVERPDGSLRFHCVKAPSGTELTRLTQTLARRIGRHLERQGLLERDAENSHLAGDALETGPMEQLPGSSITYRIAVGPQQGRVVHYQPHQPVRVWVPAVGSFQTRASSVATFAGTRDAGGRHRG